MARRLTAENALRTHHAWFAALEAAGIATFDWYPADHRLVWSREFETLYGFTVGSYDGSYAAWFDRVHPDDRARSIEQVETALRTGTLSMDYRVIWPDGSVHWLECRAQTYFDSQRKPVHMVGVVVETTRLMRSEAALRSSEASFALAFQSSPDAIAISRRLDGRLIDVNDRWQKMFGYDRAQAIGRAPSDLGIYLRDDDRRQLWAEVDAHDGVQSFEFDARTSSGDIRRAMIAIQPVNLGGESCLVTIIRDVTEQRRAESRVEEQHQQLAHLNRVVTLAALSGALAHELQQPLTAILANAYAAERLLAREPLDVAELRDITRDIRMSNERASEVVERLRALMQRRPSTMATVYANQLVEEVVEIARRDLQRRSVSVNIRPDPTNPALLGDAVQIHQVLLNLVLNACDAMAEIDPSVRQLTMTTSGIGTTTVEFAVIDRGHGISAANMPRLFEPFFTSKENGLGLGLAISRTIVDAHGGRLWAENNVDGGATFRLALRRAGSPAFTISPVSNPAVAST